MRSFPKADLDVIRRACGGTAAMLVQAEKQNLLDDYLKALGEKAERLGIVLLETDPDVTNADIWDAIEVVSVFLIRGEKAIESARSEEEKSEILITFERTKSSLDRLKRLAQTWP